MANSHLSVLYPHNAEKQDNADFENMFSTKIMVYNILMYCPLNFPVAYYEIRKPFYWDEK